MWSIPKERPINDSGCCHQTISDASAVPELAGKDSNLIAVDVLNRRHAHVGKVQDVAIHNRIAYLVLSFNIGSMRGKLYALPWKAVYFDNGLRAFVLSLSPEEIERLPVFENGVWPEPNRSESLHVFDYREIPPF